MDGFAELIERKRQGSLKVYLGYAAGVGKTYAMLQEGLRLKQQHVDVVIGYLEPHDRPETMALAEHLETVPPREWRVGDAVFHEMDVEAILARKPQVVLVDELAHTNADGSKNDKRYSDVLEVLAQGINVFRPSTCSIWNPWRRASKRPPASPCGNASRTPCCGGPIRSSTWT